MQYRIQQALVWITFGSAWAVRLLSYGFLTVLLATACAGFLFKAVDVIKSAMASQPEELIMLSLGFFGALGVALCLIAAVWGINWSDRILLRYRKDAEDDTSQDS